MEAIVDIYELIHEQEQKKQVQIGWIPGVYPVEATAQAALSRGDLFVYEEEGVILASAIINKIQVDCYADGEWLYDTEDAKIMVLHTLVVSPAVSKRGIGRSFVAFYESYAKECGCDVLRMDTNAINVVARDLYRKLGYREAGIVSCDFNGIPNIQLVLLEKKI